MAERGVFAVDRGVFEHPIFAAEPFTEREAWLWMIGAAAWKPMRVRVGRHVCDLARGQLSFSERFLAVKFQWSKSKVHRFLRRLETEAMANLSTDHEVNLITICNYNNYQFGRTGDEPSSEPQTEPLADQSRTKEEELKEGKKEEKKENRSLRSLDDWPKDFQDRFWQAYPRKAGKAVAMRRLDQVRRRGDVNFCDLIGGVERYAVAARQIEPQFVKHPATWLNAGCWDDDPAALAAGNRGPPSRPHEPSFREIAEQLRGGIADETAATATGAAGEDGGFDFDGRSDLHRA